MEVLLSSSYSSHIHLAYNTTEVTWCQWINYVEWTMKFRDSAMHSQAQPGYPGRTHPRNHKSTMRCVDLHRHLQGLQFKRIWPGLDVVQRMHLSCFNNSPLQFLTQLFDCWFKLIWLSSTPLSTGVSLDYLKISRSVGLLRDCLKKGQAPKQRQSNSFFWTAQQREPPNHLMS